MNKYIQDFIRNNSRSIFYGLTRPQKKAITEVIRGFFTAGTPILRHLAQDPNKTAKKQGEKYSYHLGKVDLKEKVEEFSVKKAKGEVRKNTIIAYDLTDIAKEAAKKMAKIQKLLQGANLAKLEDDPNHPLPQQAFLVFIRIMIPPQSVSGTQTVF